MGNVEMSKKQIPDVAANNLKANSTNPNNPAFLQRQKSTSPQKTAVNNSKANQTNLNNPAVLQAQKAAANNRSRQMNPEHPAFKNSKASSKAQHIADRLATRPKDEKLHIGTNRYIHAIYILFLVNKCISCHRFHNCNGRECGQESFRWIESCSKGWINGKGN